jgi:hypothetical protein
MKNKQKNLRFKFSIPGVCLFQQIKMSGFFIYGLPKIHKPNVPLRPIAASQGSTTHALAKYLAEIFETDSVGKSSRHKLYKYYRVYKKSRQFLNV